MSYPKPPEPPVRPKERDLREVGGCARWVLMVVALGALAVKATMVWSY